MKSKPSLAKIHTLAGINLFALIVLPLCLFVYVVAYGMAWDPRYSSSTTVIFTFLTLFAISFVLQFILLFYIKNKFLKIFSLLVLTALFILVVNLTV